ncbi:MAG: ATP-binding protein, partial [Thermofilum sp.]|nr:ATP-binding protein [Thermofilum sp.]
VKQFVVGNVLALLFKKFTAYRVKGENRLLLFVIEEAQNYAPNTLVYPVGFSVAKKILASVATQGRKFGLCLGLVTQRPSYVDPIVMSMMNTFIIHRVAPGDVRFVSTVTGGLPRYIERRLTYMEPGLAVLTGQMNVFPYPVFVKIDRRVSHKYSSLA